MSAVILRIILRYLAGALVARGALSVEFGDALLYDPDIAAFVDIGLGVLIGAATEGFYYLARRYGWAK